MKKTAEYEGYVNKAYDLADEIAEARPNQTERVYSKAASNGGGNSGTGSNNSSNGDGFMNLPEGMDNELPFN